MKTKTQVITARWLAVVAGTLWFTSLAGCGVKPTDDRLVGKWEVDSKREDRVVFNFNGDGTYSISYGAGDQRREDPGRWRVLRHTEFGILVRFGTGHAPPTDRIVEFFDDRIDFREKDGGFITSYFRPGTWDASAVVKKGDDQSPETDAGSSPPDGNSVDAPIDGSPLDGVNFDASRGRLPKPGK